MKKATRLTKEERVRSRRLPPRASILVALPMHRKTQIPQVEPGGTFITPTISCLASPPSNSDEPSGHCIINSTKVGGGGKLSRIRAQCVLRQVEESDGCLEATRVST